MRPLLVAGMACAAVGAVTWGLSLCAPDSPTFALGLTLSVAAVYVPLVWYLVCTDRERQLLIAISRRPPSAACPVPAAER